MLDHPRHHSVIYWDVFANPRLEAQLNCPEEPADQAAADLGAAVGLGIVGCGLFLRELVEAAALDLG